MSNKIVDYKKKNRFSILYDNVSVGDSSITFDHADGNSLYKGGIIITVIILDDDVYTNAGVEKYIGSFEMSAGNLQQGTLNEMYAVGSGALDNIVLESASNLLNVTLTNSGSIKDIRIDFEFIMPDEDYMVFRGTL